MRVCVRDLHVRQAEQPNIQEVPHTRTIRPLTHNTHSTQSNATSMESLSQKTKEGETWYRSPYKTDCHKNGTVVLFRTRGFESLTSTYSVVALCAGQIQRRFLSKGPRRVANPHIDPTEWWSKHIGAQTVDETTPIYAHTPIQSFPLSSVFPDVIRSFPKVMI